MNKKAFSIIKHTILLVLIALFTPISSASARFLGLTGNVAFSSSERNIKNKRTLTTPLLTTITSSSSKSESELENYSFSMSQRLTKVLSVSGSVSHTVRRFNGAETDSTSPIVSLSFKPPSLYVFNFSYGRTQTFPSDRFGIITSNMSLGFALPKVSKLPSLSVRLSRNTTQDDQVVHLIDSVSSVASFSSAYSYPVAGNPLRVGFSLGLSKTENRISEIVSEQTSNSISLGWGKSFFERKLRSNFSLSYSSTESEYSSSAPMLFKTPLTRIEGLAQINLPTSPVLVESTLIDNDTSTLIAGSPDIDSEVGWNFGVGVGLVPELVQSVELYLLVPIGASTTDFISNNSLIMAGLGWEMYTTSDNASVPWGPATGIPVSPASVNYVGTSGVNTIFLATFEFSIQNTRYIKLYNSGVAARGYTIGVSEIEVSTNIQGTLSRVAKQSSNSNAFGFSLEYKHSKNLSINYSFSASQGESDTSKGSKSMSHNVSSRLRVSDKLGLNGRFNNSSSKNLDNGSDYSTNSVGLSSSYRPMSTLSGSLSFSLSGSSLNGKKQSESNNMSLTGRAKLYEGVSLSMGLTRGGSESFVVDQETTRSTLSWNLSLQPWKRLQGTYSTSTSESSSKISGKTVKKSFDSSKVSLFFRLTDKMSLSASYVLEPKDSTSYGFSWSPTRKIQVSASYGETDSSTFNSFRVNWRVFSSLGIRLSHTVSERSSVVNYSALPPVEPLPRVVTNEAETESTRLSFNFSF